MAPPRDMATGPVAVAPARLGWRAPQAARPRRSAALAGRLARIDWAPDLAEDIGSARWFRGLGTLTGLTLAALACWPGGFSVIAPPAMVFDAAARDELRSHTIQPLALGGDSGRRMGPTGAVLPLASAPQRSAIELTATLVQGDGLARTLARAGVGESDAARAAQLIARAVPVGEIAPGTQLALRLGAPPAPGAARPLEHLALRARFDLDLTVSRAGDQLQLTRQPLSVDHTPLRIRGVVGTSLYRSARAAGAPIEAIQQYLQTLDQHLSLDTAIDPGDTFDIIVAYRRSASGERQVGELLFAGLERGGRAKAQLLRWGKEGQFFEASGMGAQRTGLIMPIYGGRVTSSFGARRHPVLGYTRMHSGIDFGAPHGAPIYAVGDARVLFSGWHGGHGNYVKLDHGGGFATAYAHMSRIAVPSGARVSAGQVIGYVGSTGLSTGPHLHYELYRNGQAVNPLSVRFTVSNQVDARQLAAFKARIGQLKAVAPGAALATLGGRPVAATATPAREIARLGS